MGLTSKIIERSQIEFSSEEHEAMHEILGLLVAKYRTEKKRILSKTTLLEFYTWSAKQLEKRHDSSRNTK